MNIKLFLLTLISLMVAIATPAKSMRSLWQCMPDSLIPYLDANLRQEMVDFADMQVKTQVKNLLDGNSSLDTLTSNYADISLNSCSRMQLRLLPSSQGDSLLCMVLTVSAPERESVVRFFTQAWQPIPSQRIPQVLMPDGKGFTPDVYLVRPDTMSQARFDELRAMIEPAMVYATLSPSDDSLILQLAFPLVSDEQRKALDIIRMQRKLKWDGVSFKEN